MSSSQTGDVRETSGDQDTAAGDDGPDDRASTEDAALLPDEVGDEAAEESGDGGPEADGCDPVGFEEECRQYPGAPIPFPPRCAIAAGGGAYEIRTADCLAEILTTSSGCWVIPFCMGDGGTPEGIDFATLDFAAEEVLLIDYYRSAASSCWPVEFFGNVCAWQVRIAEASDCGSGLCLRYLPLVDPCWGTGGACPDEIYRFHLVRVPRTTILRATPCDASCVDPAP